MNRRQLHRLLALAGIGVVTMPLARGARAAGDELSYFTWSGYDVPEFHPGYVAKHGASPTSPIFADEEEAFQKLRAGFTADVTHPCSGRIARWRDADVIQPIDTSRLANWPDVFDSLKTINGAADGGQQWFVPVDWGNTSVIYRTDLVDLKEESYELLWDERYKGKLSIGEDITDTAILVGLLVGVKDPYEMTDEEIARVKVKLAEQKPLLRFYWSDNTVVDQALATGEIVASTAWNSSVLTLRKQGVPVAYMTPKEGRLNWCCGLVLNKTATHIDLAHDLIDAMIASDAGEWLVKENGYGHSNRKTFDLVDDETLAALDLPRNPAEMLATGVFSKDNKRLDDLQQMFEEVKAGS